MVGVFRSRLFHRYFLLFAANLVFFIAILASVIYFIFVQTFLQNQFAEASISSLSHLAKSVEYFLQKTDDIAKYYALFDGEAISYSYQPIVQNSTLYQFLRRVRNQRVIDDNIHSIYFYYRTQDRIIDITTSELYSIYPGDTSTDRDARKGDFYDTGWLAAAEAGQLNRYGFILLPTRPLYTVKDINKPDPFERTLLNQHPNTNVITLIRAFENKAESPRDFVIANLRESVLSEFLGSAHATSPETSFIMTTGAVVVSREDKDYLNRDLSSEDYAKRIMSASATEGLLVSKIAGVKSAVVYVKSSYVDWVYVSLVPYAYITRDLNYLTRVILITIFLIAASAVASVYMLTKRVYSPIEAIFQKIRRISVDGSASPASSDVRRIETLLDEFKRSYDRLGKLVFDNYYLLKYNFLGRLIAGEATAEELESGFQEYQVRFGRDGFTVVRIAIDDLADVLKTCSLQEIYVAKQTIISIAEKILGEKYVTVGTNVDQRHVLLIVNGAGERDVADVCQRLEAVIHMVMQLLQLSISAGVGRPCAGLPELKRSCEQATVALANRLHKGKGAVIRYDELGVEATDRSGNLSASEEQIVAALRSGQRDKCMAALDVLLQEIRDKGMLRPQVESIFLELVVLLHRQLSNADRSFDEICGASFPDVLASIASFETLDDLKRSMEGIFGCLARHYAESKKSHNTEVVARVMSYLQTHYDQLLSLDVVADNLKVTPQYVSRLIKDVTGVNFLDYLTDVRMKKAEELLVQTSLSVQEIAQRVGYPVYRTFLLNFRAHTAMIPTQYRKMKNSIVGG